MMFRLTRFLSQQHLTQQQQFYHIPVLLNECVKNIMPPSTTVAIENNKHPLIFVDATFGLGGYTKAILSTYTNSRVIAFDMDYHSDNGRVREAAERVIQQFGHDRFRISGYNFRQMSKFIQIEQEIPHVDGIVFDLGVSSMQLDDKTRGFSFRPDLDGPLDMRMGQITKPDGSTNNSLTAQTVVNELSEQELFTIIHEYGEDKYARKIAQAIVQNRRKTEINTTGQLASIIRSAIPKGSQQNNKDPATRTFQALRIYVNDELASLKDALLSSQNLLRPGGRLCVVSYHSLEDRITKRFLQHTTSSSQQLFKVLTKDPIIPSSEEVSINPRSRSAKLRVAERTKVNS